MKQKNQYSKPLQTASKYLRKLGMNHVPNVGEISINQMVRKIVAHPDQDDLIDNVFGIEVWEKIEGEFTCTEFLEFIEWPQTKKVLC